MKPRNGARPVPGPIITIGTDGLNGSRNCDLRTNTGTCMGQVAHNIFEQDHPSVNIMNGRIKPSIHARYLGFEVGSGLHVAEVVRGDAFLVPVGTRVPVGEHSGD